jgi:hypothetical protein
MSFRVRLMSVLLVLACLLALLVLGTLFSPDKVQARTSGRPLLPGVSAQKVDGIDVTMNGQTRVSLRKTAGGWETHSGTRTFPGSADRIATFLRTVAGLPRTSLVSSDPRRLAELGLSEDGARTLVLHQTDAPEVILQVGKRGPSGDADYVQVSGEASAYLARGSLAFFLAQEPSYWYELHVLPDDVQGTTIASITVSGSIAVDDSGTGVLRGGYTLRRPSGEKQDEWVVGSPERPADRVAAGAMASSLALLEGVDFADSPGGTALTAGATAGGQLDIRVATFAGKAYSISVRRGPEPGKVRITTDWSQWTYVVNALLLPRAVLPEAKLAAAR